MALWEVNNGNKTVIVFANGSLSITNPPPYLSVRRKFYKVPYSNVGKGAIIESNGKTFHVPSWTEVHSGTTVEDILVEKKPFQELFVEPKIWSFKSASSDKEYTVRLNKAGKLSCDCWGYMAHKKCKHVKEVQESLC
jgi:hypothetical protein